MNILIIKRVLQIMGFLLLLASYVIAYRSGYAKAQVEFQNKELLNTNALLNAMAELEKQRSVVNDRVVEKYITRIQYVHAKEKQLSNEVPKYVTSSSDSNCAIPLGFQLHWNKSNQVNFSDTTERTDVPAHTDTNHDTPTNLKLSDVSEQHLEEAVQCKATEEQLIQLQEWIDQQLELH